MRRLSFLLTIFLCLFASSAGAQDTAVLDDKVRVAYIYSDGNIPGTIEAYGSLLSEHPELEGRLDILWLSESTYDQTDPNRLLEADALIFDMMNEQMLQKFDAENEMDLLGHVVKNGTVIAVGQGLLGEGIYADKGAVLDTRARAYWQHSGASNRLGLLKMALQATGVDGLNLPDVQESFDNGYYYPEGPNGRGFRTWEEFDTWRQKNGKKNNGPRIAIGFYKASYYNGDTALIDALVTEVERQGGQAIPFFGYPGSVAFQKLMVNADGSPRVDAAVVSNMQFEDMQSSARLETVGVPIINLIVLYGRSEADWRESRQGLSFFEGTFNLAVPELAGTIAPTVVGTKEKVVDLKTGMSAVVTSPVSGRVSVAVSRAMKYVALREIPNAQKNIALMYYNYPSGKGNIGASYLNVAETLENMLSQMHNQGYDIGGPPPSADEILANITENGVNITSHAPGELQDMVDKGTAITVKASIYQKWLNGYSKPLREKILSDWGDPEKPYTMTVSNTDGTSFVIPQVRYGKVVLLPQPVRGWGENLEQLYHAKDLSPPHQYVATYSWLRESFGANAIVHIGTHGTLEWLDGKDVGLSEDDAPDALIGDIPNPYIYNVDVVGEGLVARRRSAATLVDHMTPPFVKGELTEDLAALGELVNDHAHNATKNPELEAAYNKKMMEKLTEMGIAKDLDFDPEAEITHAQIHQVEDYLLELKEQLIPYGMHALGRLPEAAALESTVEAVVSADRSQLPDERKIMASEMRERIETSAVRELSNFIQVLDGRFIPTGGGGEPIRNPDAYPTGKNFVGIDPDKVPKPAAYEMGIKLADQMLADHFETHGEYPDKVSFVIWGDETIRHEGVLEAQIFHLLGTRPVWNARGKVVDVEIIPRAELGRPRVDIVIASASEGLFANVTNLMDKAVQLVKALEEADNMVRKHYLETRFALIRMGKSEEDADRLAGVRIFDEPPGTYNLNTSSIVAESGSWDSDDGFANEYINKMGHGYGNGFWGEPMQDVFRLNLSGIDKVVHSNSTTLYGALDNDDMFMYMGGLASAVRSLDGKSPELLVTNTRDPGNPVMSNINKFIGQEFRSRYVNPTWIEGMQGEGYAGARAMSEFIEYMWGWDATVTETVDNRMWQETFEVYVEDKYEMGMDAFFDENSPFAYQDITARMVETIRKGNWDTDQATKTKLLTEYIESIKQHGVGCSEVSCGNARLLEYILDEAKAAKIPSADIQQAKAALEQQLGMDISAAARVLKTFAKTNGARTAKEVAEGREVLDNKADTEKLETVDGYVMEERDQSQKENAPDRPEVEMSVFSLAWPPLAVLCLIIAWFFFPTTRRHG